MNDSGLVAPRTATRVTIVTSGNHVKLSTKGARFSSVMRVCGIGLMVVEDQWPAMNVIENILLQVNMVRKIGTPRHQ